jgi:hypothetical protein
MRGWQGFAIAMLALTLFEATVSSSGATQNAAGITALPAKVVAALVDPTQTIWGDRVGR